MKIVKVINNNVVSSEDRRGREIVIMGKGIGFQKKKGDTVDESKIEKIFSLPSESTNQFEELVRNIPYEHMELAEEIIKYAGELVGKTLNKNIYITLTDHLNYAIERTKQNILLQNAFLWEMQKLYSREFEVGKHALELVRNKVGVSLPVDEAGFIALHVVNAEMDANMEQTAAMPGMLHDMLNIIRYTIGHELDEGTISYERLVTHLKFYLQRILKEANYQGMDAQMCEEIRKSYPEEWGCALKIGDFVRKKMGYETPEEELIYLTLHISRVARDRRPQANGHPEEEAPAAGMGSNPQKSE